MYKLNDQGKESEWNEANFKSKRLHEVQELMNELKINLLGKTNGEWNYILYARSISILMGEGRSKYTPKEKERVDKIRKLIEKFMMYKPIHSPSIKDDYKGKQIVHNLNKENYDRLTSLLYDFEMLIRDYNDVHGLTTKNKDMDDEGL